METISIIIPVLNEARTLREILQRVAQADAAGLRKEIIVVDDASSDGTLELLKRAAQYHSLGARNITFRVYYHAKNRGKGAALRTGFEKASGDILLVQDADLEYDPRDYTRLLRPIFDGSADVVYGSRFLAHKRKKGYPTHFIANRILTALSNICSRKRLTDAETCYKVFKKNILNKIELQENGFGFDLEFTAKISRLEGIKIKEVPVSYRPRSYAEGKKITLRDGFRAVYCIIRYNVFG